MFINLNKKLVTKDLLLKKISDLDIYSFYTNKDIKINTPMSSPLRQKDDHPSFAFFVGEKAEILFKDFVLGGGDCIKFVQMMFNLNFFEALSKIVIDFNLKNYFNYKKIDNKTISKKLNYQCKEDLLKNVNLNIKLQKKSRDWKLHDLKFWMKFGIDIETLNLYNVQPISHIFINDNPIGVDNYAYCFTEFKDGKETYKIYQPYNTKYKWLNNHNDSVWQGWTQLPEKGDRLIITKSLKDVMSIHNVLNIPSISLQAEGVLPKQHIIDQLKDRFKEIIILYDNDFDKEINWGYKFGKKISELYNIRQLLITDYFKCKDFSDLVKVNGVEESKKIWKNHIDIPF